MSIWGALASLRRNQYLLVIGRMNIDRLDFGIRMIYNNDQDSESITDQGQVGRQPVVLSPGWVRDGDVWVLPRGKVRR